jgi:aryl-alcohol dehydrogenase-like predicted oxidoreductase
MQKHTIPGTDLSVSALCYGTASWGHEVVGRQLDRLLNAFRDAGGNFLDTAHCYACWTPQGAGVSERAIADYVRRNGGNVGEPDALVVATKGGHPTFAGYRTVDRYLAAERVAADIDDSLARLEREVIDLYLLHRDDPRMEVCEIVEYLNAEVRRGRIRYFGASNWTAARIAAANDYAAAHGLMGFVISEPQWSLAYRNSGGDATLGFLSADDHAWHSRSGMPVMPYSSTAGGYFATGGRSHSAQYDNEISRGRLARAQQLAAELGCTPGQVALAYLKHQPFPVIPILGTTKRRHLEDAIGALQVSLTEAQVDWLRDG